MSFSLPLRITRFLKYAALPAVILLFAGLQTYAQENADRIIVKVGKNRIILQSELEMEFNQFKIEHPGATDSIKCYLLQRAIFQKILAEQADRDSVVISDEEVDANMENRLRYYIQMAGSQERLEQQMGKTIVQIKDENKDIIREQLVSERVQSQITNAVKITPSEVKKYFDKIPVDSLPFLPATVEVGQIVMDPDVSPELDLHARTELEGIRNDIVVNGKSFEAMAGAYSADPGSRDNGGDLGMVAKGQMVPEFEKAALRLQNGEISPIVKTEFGYHIIKMESRQGDEMHLRHILIHPQRTSADFKIAMTKLDSVRAELISGKISFQLAVGKYSTEKSSKVTGGMITNPRTGSSRVEIEDLDPDMALSIDSLPIGGFSQPQMFTNQQTGDKSCRIVYLKTRTAPHKANLLDDYSNLQDVALKQKQADRMNTWLAEKLPTYYLKIDREYQNCPELAPWLVAAGKR